MDALETMFSRNSVPARLLNEPAPEGAELQPTYRWRKKG